MSTSTKYMVFPIEIDQTVKYSSSTSIFSDIPSIVSIAILVEIIGIIVLLNGGDAGLSIIGLVIIIPYFIIAKFIKDNDDVKHTKSVITEQQNKANSEADFYTLKFNSILQKSSEIINEILPFLESSVKNCLEKAKIDFTENAYSPFWSQIENASNFLACYKEALNQLCLNSEIYNYTLKKLKHNFPMPFPFTTNVSIPKMVIDEYNTIVRKAQTNPTFSIIWEQRRNSQILVGGFRTLENAVNNMNDAISSAIYDLKTSINSELTEMKFIQKSQLQSFEESRIYLNQTLNSMDDKLYYIQWKKRPPGTFYHR